MTKLTLSESVIIWYEKNCRILPWRPKKGEKSNPYYVLLSEFMLQQTVVKTVIPYFKKFIKEYPNIHKLANANLDDILSKWSGLGYYRRAKNLHETAKIISNEFGGVIPNEYKILINMPGIGDYTASAILAISYEKSINVVDGNIERVMSRVYKVEKRIDLAKKEIKLLSSINIPKKNPSLYVQGLMDIGASVCRPKRTFCSKCPIKTYCKVAFKKKAILLPLKIKKFEKPIRKGNFLCFIKQRQKLLLIKNDNVGLFSNMNVLPAQGFEDKIFPIINFKYTGNQNKIILPQLIYHSFTHFDLEAKIIIYELNKINLERPYEFINFCDLENKPIPKLFKKIINYITDYLNINV